MITFKCKMCGGDLIIIEKNSVCECEFCGTKQTIPTVDNEKKANLFNRANRLRMNAEFDRAASVYASISAEFPEEAEAYWGMCLCKYGIEYVDDPTTGNKIPTCHRTLSESILDDEDFIQACENSDPVAKRVYREEAKAIDRLQQDILSIVANEAPYDVFICYKETDENGNRTEDSVLAQDIYDSLTGKGLKVFFARITLEDKLGQQYEPYIYAALHSARVMLAVGTQFDYFDAVWVKNEWARFLDIMRTDKKKTLIPCYKDIDAYDMPREFKNLQAQDMGKLGWLQDLSRGVVKLCGKKEEREEQTITSQAIQNGNPTAESLLRRSFVFLEDQDWSHAEEYADKVLDLDVSNGYAYLVKLLSELKLCRPEELSSLEDLFDQSIQYRKILRFGNEELKAQIESSLQEIRNRKQRKREQTEQTRQKVILDQYREQLCKARTEDDIFNVESALRKIATYEGVDELLDACKQRLYAHQEAERRIAEYQDDFSQIEQQYQATIFELDKMQADLAAKQNELDGCVERASMYQKEIDQIQGKVFGAKRRLELQDSLSTEKNAIEELNNQIEELHEKIKHTQAEESAAREKWEAIVFQIAGIYYHTQFYLDALMEYEKIPDYQDVASMIANDPHLIDAAKEENLLSLQLKGSIFHFGSYKQDEHEEKRDIEWLVLDVQATVSLIISRYCLFAKEYSAKCGDISWENSTLRSWLNEKFIKEAFSNDEKNEIIPIGTTESIRNESNNTQDKIFLLTKAEAQKYFKDNGQLVAEPTEYAESQECYVDEEYHTCYWWLKEEKPSQDTIEVIGPDGSLDRVTANSNGIGVRPALWISNNSHQF